VPPNENQKRISAFRASQSSRLMTTSVSRRKALKFTVLACASTLLGCRFGNDENQMPLGQVGNSTPSPAPAPSAPVAPAPSPLQAVWDPSPWLLFSSSKATARLDMSITLPAGVRRGGIFALAANSTALPAGATLTSAGILSVVNPIVGSTSDVIFTYSEPNT